MSRKLSSSSSPEVSGSGGSAASPLRWSPRRTLSFVALAFGLYLALLFPWRAAAPGYAALVAPASAGLVRLVDADTRVAREGGLLRYTRLYPRLRVAARADLAQNPLPLHWLRALAPDLLRPMYPGGTRPFVRVERVDLYRLTLELPLFLALLLALPRLPWRRRLRHGLVGLLVLYALHATLGALSGIEVALGAEHVVLEQGRLVDPTTSAFWQQALERYQYVGPVIAFALVLGPVLAVLRRREPA